MKKRIVAMMLTMGMLATLFTGCAKEEKSASSGGSGGSVSYGSQPAFVGDEDETYYFVSWFAGNEWWVGGYEGFKDAARQLGVKTECTGATDDAVDSQIAVIEQVKSQNPSGICLAVSDGSAFGDTVQGIIDEGIPVTCTDNDIEGANKLMYMAYDDAGMTKQVADYIGEQTDGKGKIALLEVVGQANLELRSAAFKENLANDWKDMELVATANSGHDELQAASDTASILAANKDLDYIFTLNATAAMGAVTAVQEAGSDCKVITMDVNENVLDYIEEGKIDAAIMPDSYTFGYLSMLALYTEKHELMDPMWTENGDKNGWCVPYMEVGSSIVTKGVTERYYTSKYYEGRGSKGFDEGAQDMTNEDLPGYWTR